MSIGRVDLDLDGEWALVIFSARPEESSDTPPSVYNSLLSACGRAEAWEKAVAIWHEMISEGSSTPAPDAASAALTIRGCSQGSSWQASLEVFRQAKDHECITIGSSAYNAALYAVAVGRSWGGALALLEEMAAESVPMTRSTRNAALRACTLGVPKQEALWASTRALALLREHGLKTPREAWEALSAEGLPAHAELTEAGLNFAASRVELLLLNLEGEEASGVDFDEGPRSPMLAGEFVPGSTLHEELDIHPLPTGLSLQLLGLPGPYSATDVAATESCREALQSQVSAAFSPGDATVHLVGSRLYGAALEGADVDVVVELSPDIQEAVLGESDGPMAVEDRCRLLSSRSVLRLQRHFEGVRSDKWHRIEAVLDTRRPLLRLCHSPPGHAALKVEVGFDPSLAAVQKSSMLSSLEGPSLALARLIRQWTMARRVAGQQAGYPSGFAWCLLAVFYCQVRRLEPPLGSQSPHDWIDGRFRKPVLISEKALSEAAALLPGFFAFYAEHFRWTEEVVSTRLGRRTFRALQPSPKRADKVLCIEDPLEPDSDLAAAYLSAGRDRRLRAELRRAKRLLRRGPGTTARDANDIDLWAKCFRLRRDV
eukprot:s3748_g1.t2